MNANHPQGHSVAFTSAATGRIWTLWLTAHPLHPCSPGGGGGRG
jgi:hypothetical protein